MGHSPGNSLVTHIARSATRYCSAKRGRKKESEGKSETNKRQVSAGISTLSECGVQNLGICHIGYWFTVVPGLTLKELVQGPHMHDVVDSDVLEASVYDLTYKLLPRGYDDRSDPSSLQSPSIGHP